MEQRYTVIYSGRRTLALEITRDLRVLVRAPRQVSQERIAQFVADHARWLAVHRPRMEDWLRAHPEPTAQQAEAYRRAAADSIPKRVAYYGERMNLTPTGVRITGAKTRFGSCSAKNSLCFSWRLMAYPDAAIDYVVVHELAHIVHKNHGGAFYALVAEQLPDWQACRRLLR